MLYFWLQHNEVNLVIFVLFCFCDTDATVWEPVASVSSGWSEAVCFYGNHTSHSGVSSLEVQTHSI